MDMDLKALNPFVGVFNNPYLISSLVLFTMIIYPLMAMGCLLYEEVLHVVKALFICHKKLQCLLYVPEQLFLEFRTVH